jgi:hypothetical protein
VTSPPAPGHWPGALPAAWSPLHLEMHYPPLPCPDGHCTFLVCSHCSAGGFTRQHVSSNGRCPYGHLASDPAQLAPLTAKLAAWTAEQGITPSDSHEALAARLVASLGPGYVTARLESGATEYLRNAAEAYASPRELTDPEWAAENYWHGHGTRS